MSKENCRLCGHSWNAHQHYRGGEDCGICHCAQYRNTYWFHYYLDRARMRWRVNMSGRRSR